MAKRTLNRRQLRQDNDQAERDAQTEPAAETDADDEAEEKPVKAKAPKKAKAPAAPRVRKPPKKKAPVRMRARWGVFDNGMKQVAVFDYNQRGAADQKLADLNAKKGGSHFLQIVKEPIPAAPAPLPA
jgi:hypothetical protein